MLFSLYPSEAKAFAVIAPFIGRDARRLRASAPLARQLVDLPSQPAALALALGEGRLHGGELGLEPRLLEGQALVHRGHRVLDPVELGGRAGLAAVEQAAGLGHRVDQALDALGEAV